MISEGALIIKVCITETDHDSHRPEEGDIVGLALPLCHLAGVDRGGIGLQSLSVVHLNPLLTIVHSNRNSPVK